MKAPQTILPSLIKQVLLSNDVAQIQLKDGTILTINDSGSKNGQYIDEKEENHSHHKGDIGYFGHHFKTEYTKNVCPDCMNREGAVIKKRQNYVLYVSKHCSDNDVALKHKMKNEQIKEDIKEQIKEKIEEQIQDQIVEQIKENIEEQINNQVEEQNAQLKHEKEQEEEIQKEEKQEEIQENNINEHQEEQEEHHEEQEEHYEEQVEHHEEQEEHQEEHQENGNKPEEVIIEGYVECNEVPILEEKIVLRKDQEEKPCICDECKKEENAHNIENNENICHECEQEENNIEQNIEIENNEQEGEGELEENNDVEEMNNQEEENINEIGEDENICDECQEEAQNGAGSEQKVTQTVQELIPENQNEN